MRSCYFARARLAQGNGVLCSFESCFDPTKNLALLRGRSHQIRDVRKSSGRAAMYRLIPRRAPSRLGPWPCRGRALHMELDSPDRRFGSSSRFRVQKEVLSGWDPAIGFPVQPIAAKKLSLGWRKVIALRKPFLPAFQEAPIRSE
jgi:hypothetical protein